MSKGIRAFANAKFMELLPQRAELGDRAFRKAVWTAVQAQFGVSVASACSHYNYAFQLCKKEHPELVVGLGRPPEKNNGGRKKRAAGPLLLTWNGHSNVIALGWSGSKAAEFVDADGAAQATYEVRKKKNAEVVAVVDTWEAAQAMIRTPNLKIGGKFVGKLYAV